MDIENEIGELNGHVDYLSTLLRKLTARVLELERWRDATAGRVSDLQNQMPGDHEFVAIGAIIGARVLEIDRKLSQRITSLESRVRLGLAERARCVDCGTSIGQGSCRCSGCAMKVVRGLSLEK